VSFDRGDGSFAFPSRLCVCDEYVHGAEGKPVAQPPRRCVNDLATNLTQLEPVRLCGRCVRWAEGMRVTRTHAHTRTHTPWMLAVMTQSRPILNIT
jgi:hypothetical protein